MKNLFGKIMFVAVAAMAFASCSNDEIYVAPETEGFEVSINANTTDTTRSAFGEYNADSKTYPTLWDGDETWFAAINDKYTQSITTITFSDDLKQANANFELSGVPSASDDGTYTLYALSPASAWSSYNLSNDYLRFYIARSTQTPNANSCDPASQVLFAKSEPMANANSFDVDFKHLSAYVKFSFTNVAEGGVVRSVSVTSEDVNLAGRYQYTPSTGELVEHDNLATGITLVTNSTENLWLAVAPVDVSGKVLTFSITTDKGILAKEVTMPATAKFESGKVVTFNVNMEGIEYPTAEDAETWQLITKVADITDGEYIIVAKNNEDNIVYLPSATTSSAPAQTVITVTGLDLSNTEEFKTTLIPADARFTFTGNADAVTITNADGKYLYTTTSNNGLRVGNTNNTWKIAAHASVNQSLSLQYSSTSRYIALYNSQDWRCYTSSHGSYTGNNTAQNGVTYLYKKITNDPAISAAAIEVEAIGGEGVVSYSVKNMVDDVTATSTDEWITVFEGDGNIPYEVDPNYTGAVRTGKITLSSASTGITKDVAVTQVADELKVSNAVVSLDAVAESTATFTVTSTYAATISVDDATKWSVSLTNIEAGTTEITVTALTANEGEKAIEGAITITRTADSKSIEVAITQNAATAETKKESVTFSEQNYANGQAIESYTGTNFTVTFAKGSNSNAPKYYTSGEAIRCYGGNTFTVSSGKKIIKIELTFGDSDGSNIITASSESYSNGTWTGSSDNVTFAIGGTSGNRRIAGISVTYTE